jgi:chitin disaccharide deacetylase
MNMLNEINYLDHQILINADDFGYNTEVNSAIYRCFQLGMIHTTSLLVNMDGFDDAIKIVRSNPDISKNIGIHLNLTEGLPLVDSIKSCPRFCDGSGRFIYTRKKSLLFLNAQEKSALYQEMKAQMIAIQSAGIHPNHIDSHHHIHTEWPILNLVIRLAKEQGIQKIRYARNMGDQKNYSKKMYRLCLNNYLKYRMGLPKAGLFGNLDDFIISMGLHLTNDNRSIEIMVHPTLNQRNEIMDGNGVSLPEKLFAVFPNLKMNANFKVD